jgi:hypothetical protein
VPAAVPGGTPARLLGIRLPKAGAAAAKRAGAKAAGRKAAPRNRAAPPKRKAAAKRARG